MWEGRSPLRRCAFQELQERRESMELGAPGFTMAQVALRTASPHPSLQQASTQAHTCTRDTHAMLRHTRSTVPILSPAASPLCWNTPSPLCQPACSHGSHSPRSPGSSELSPGGTELMAVWALPHLDRSHPRATHSTPNLGTSSLASGCKTQRLAPDSLCGPIGFKVFSPRVM